jgi:hypothetical protein
MSDRAFYLSRDKKSDRSLPGVKTLEIYFRVCLMAVGLIKKSDRFLNPHSHK